jgi:anti-sigma B factor antagonist
VDIDASRPAGPSASLQVVVLPDEIDLVNAGRVEDQLRAALRPGVSAVIADMSATTFADSSAIRALLAVRDAAAASRAELRLVIPAPEVLRILQLLGLDSMLQIYPSLAAAQAAAGPLLAS